MISKKFVLTALLSLVVIQAHLQSIPNREIIIGSYYFDGWTGVNSSNEEWAKDAPDMLTKKMFFDFADREPIWGWRDDDLNIMEKQIDLASKNGIDFFVFCWYWSTKDGHVDVDACLKNNLHTGINLFLKARNKNKMRFAIIICNHGGYELNNNQEWEVGMEFLADFIFKDKQYLFIEDKPYVSFFNAEKVRNYLPAMSQKLKTIGFQGMYSVSCNYRDQDFDLAAWYNNTFEGGKVHKAKDYQELTDRTRGAWYKTSNSFVVSPSCIVGWDRRPWYQEENFIYYDQRTPKKFLKHLKDAVDFLYDRNDRIKILHIYAWNELGEGGYLVPTKGDPRGLFLKQVKKAKRYGRRRLRLLSKGSVDSIRTIGEEIQHTH